MFTIVTIAVLSGLALLLNAYAAQVADRGGERRAALEARWERMIEAAQHRR